MEILWGAGKQAHLFVDVLHELDHKVYEFLFEQRFCVEVRDEEADVVILQHEHKSDLPSKNVILLLHMYFHTVHVLPTLCTCL